MSKDISIQALGGVQYDLDDQGVIFFYSGYLSEDILLGIGTTLRQRMVMSEVERSVSRAVFAIFVELAQNIIRYSADVLHQDGDPPSELRHGMLAVGEADGRCYVQGGNMVARGEVERLREHLTRIREMEQEQLRTVYKDVLRGETPAGSKGAGVGSIDIARRARHGFEFHFADADAERAYFFVRAVV